MNIARNPSTRQLPKATKLPSIDPNSGKVMSEGST